MEARSHPCANVLSSEKEARVWKGSGLSTTDQGIRVLGTPLGHADFVETQLRERLDDHQLLQIRIPEVPDLQSAWALLQHCCASARAYCMLRVVRPELVHGNVEGHDKGAVDMCVQVSRNRC